jgi:putative transcriptional regulator
MFSKIMGVSVSTVEYWESGKNIPNGSAQRLLSLIKVKKEKFIEEDLMKLNV